MSYRERSARGAAVNPKVDAYIGRSTQWPAEMTALQKILLGCGLTEEIKWGKPCYIEEGQNIAIMQEMKSFLALMFFKGALIADPDGLLHEQGPNSRSAKRMEFTSVAEIVTGATAIERYVAAAIAAEAAGVQPAPAPALELVDELRERLADSSKLAEAFSSLTPGRQREYNLFVSGAKQSATRHSRIDGFVDRVLAGKGLRD
jgi:uncharacterized protein YdeI (YjbR/CyaY-like superfamily)